jgi:glycolate oxidase
MSVEIDTKNLSVSCPSKTSWRELSEAARKKGFFVPVQPIFGNALVQDWLMEDLPSMGGLKYGTVYSALRDMKLTTGSRAVISTGYPGLSDFASGTNLSALLLGSRGELAAPNAAVFKLVPLGEIRSLFYDVPVPGLMKFMADAWGNDPAVYHIEFSTDGKQAAVRIMLEGDTTICAIAEKRIEGLAAKAGAKRVDARELYGAASGAGEWRLPMAILRESFETLAGAGGLAGIVERGGVRVKASPPAEVAKSWADMGYRRLGSADVNEGVARLCAQLIRVFDPDQRLSGGSALAASARELEEGPAPPLFNLIPNMTDRQKTMLKELVGDAKVSFEDYDRLVYSHDLAPLPREVEIVFKRMPDAIVLARVTEDVVKVVKFCGAHGIPLTPRGGASWGFGGCVPTQGGIVLDLSFMMAIEIREAERLAVCEPGATWKQVITAAGKAGQTAGAYPGSNPVATVAGWLSTNGAGLCSYKQGVASDQVAWVEAVLADGTVVNTRDAPYALWALFAGAEGTLGVITKVAVRLRPIPELTRPLAYSVSSVEALNGPLEALTRSPLGPLHISVYDGAHFRYQRLLGRHAPEVGGMLMVVLEGTSEGVAQEERLVDGLMEKSGAKKQPAEVADHEWEERCYELRARRLGPGGVLGEAVIPVREFGGVSSKVSVVARELGMLPSINGVVVDRNTIALMPYFLTDERTMLRSLGGAMGFVKKIVDTGVAHGGRPSGIGIFFAGNMDKMHDPATASLLSEIKQALDPCHIINPGKHTQMGTRFGVALPPFIVDIGMDVMAVLKRGMPDRMPTGNDLKERVKGAHE